jgi:hypothetical protein
MRVHGVGRSLRQIELLHLLTDIPRDELDSRLHLGHHTLSFRNPLQARLNEVVSVAQGADALGDLLTLGGESLVLGTRGFHSLHNLLQTHAPLWGHTHEAKH